MHHCSSSYGVEVDPSARAKQQGKDDEADHDGPHAPRPQHRPQRRYRPPGPPHRGVAVLARRRPALLINLLRRRWHQRRPLLVLLPRRRRRREGGALHDRSLATKTRGAKLCCTSQLPGICKESAACSLYAALRASHRAAQYHYAPA